MPTVSPQLAALWAKKDSYQGREYWLPLVTHLTDTLKVIVWLYDHWLSPAQQQLMAGELSTEQTRQLLSFIGFFHDFGKATPAFQAKTSYRHDAELDHDIMQKLFRQGFSSLANFDGQAPLRSKSPHNIAGEALLEEAGLNIAVGAIIGGHHGKPASKTFDAQDQIDDYLSNYYTVDRAAGPVAGHWQAVYDDLIDYGLQLTAYDSLAAIPAVTQPQAVLIEGLLIMADWLASSEFLNHQPLFSLVSVQEDFTDINEDVRFRHAMQVWSVDDRWQPQPIDNVDQLFQRRWGFLPHVTQKKMVKAIAQIKDPGLMIVEAGCGTGKTETALASTEELAAKTKRNGLLIGLPTQATTNAMYNRVESWLNQLSKQQQAKLELSLQHGKATLNAHAQSLPEAHNFEGQSAVVTNSWFSGKKSILMEFDVATIDHLLMMSLKQKHLFLRHLAVSGKVVVIDEIHAYDIYVSSYLRRTLIWLGAYHVPVIALSATLPAKKRQDLIKAYAYGKFKAKPTPALSANELAYPLLTCLDGKQIKQVSDFPKAKPTTIEIKRLTNDDELIAQIKASLEHGGIAGVIVNTVKRSQMLYKKLGEMPKTLLHSSFLGPDRENLEEKLTKQIGKGADRPEKLVVIGTQVLEQSLDIDFDVLFTDIAPIDLLIQRIGRLHRHNIQRPASLTVPRVYITGAYSLGNYGTNAYIYEPYYLLKTDYFLPAELTLPDDTAPLIQRVYGEASDAEIAFDNLPQIRRDLQHKIKQKTQAARRYQIANPQPKKTLHGWLDDDAKQADQDEAVAQAAVRDIQPTIEAILVAKIEGRFYLIDRNQRRLLNTVTPREISEDTIRLPYAVCHHGNLGGLIDHLAAQTKRDFSTWRNDIWLRNSLVIELNQDLKTDFNGYTLAYSSQLGLTYQQRKK